MQCPKCGSNHTRKVGKIITVKKGKKQRYQCKDCGRSFYPSLGESKEES